MLLHPLLEHLLDGRREQVERMLDAALPEWWPDEHDARFLRFRVRQAGEDPAIAEWLVRAIVLRDTRAVVGHAGFHGPPGLNALHEPGAVEVGYTIFAEHRGRGYASEAVTGLISWATNERGLRSFVASVGPENEPSLAIVRKLGFEHVGEHWDDEDGRELEFQLNV